MQEAIILEEDTEISLDENINNNLESNKQDKFDIFRQIQKESWVKIQRVWLGTFWN